MKVRETFGPEEQCSYRAEVSRVDIMLQRDIAIIGWCPDHGFEHATSTEGVFQSEYNREMFEGALITCNAKVQPRISRKPPRPTGHKEHHAGQLSRYTARVVACQKEGEK
jgi:hypothetical protein